MTALVRRVLGLPEARAAYTDQILAGSYAAATGRVHAAATAGVQAASGIVGRALASAMVEGDSGAVDPHLLENIGTDLIRSRSVSWPAHRGAPADGCGFSVRVPRRV